MEWRDGPRIKDRERKIEKVKERVRKEVCSRNSGEFHNWSSKVLYLFDNLDFAVVFIEMGNRNQIAGHLGENVRWGYTFSECRTLPLNNLEFTCSGPVPWVTQRRLLSWILCCGRRGITLGLYCTFFWILFKFKILSLTIAQRAYENCRWCAVPLWLSCPKVLPFRDTPAFKPVVAQYYYFVIVIFSLPLDY